MTVPGCLFLIKFPSASWSDTSYAQVLAPFAIGFAVFIAHLCAIPLDGEPMNPSPNPASAASLGPYLLHNSAQLPSAIAEAIRLLASASAVLLV